MGSWQEHIRGVVLGAAIGDAMGHPTEFIRSFEEIRARYGPEGVTRYECYWTRGERRFAPYTDDTQMAEAVLRALLWGHEHNADLELTMRFLARLFVLWAYKPQGGHRAPGNACMRGCRMLATGTPWHEAGAEDAGGCGSVMRVYPVGVVFARDLAKAEEWAIHQSKLSHRAPSAFAACAAMAVGTAHALNGSTPAQLVTAMIEAASRHHPPTGTLIAAAQRQAAEGKVPEETLQQLLGWNAHEAIAAATYVFVRHAEEPPSAILEAANTPGDSDSIATLVGALVGARHGVSAFPASWVNDLERSEELSELADRSAAVFVRSVDG